MNPRICLPLIFAAALPLIGSAADPRGDNPDAKPLTPAEQLKLFKVPPGFEVQLVAAEPQIQKPINLNFDGAGRLWATGSELYPWAAQTDVHGQPIAGFEKMYQDAANAFAKGKAPAPSPVGKDTVRILSDFAPDGRAQKITTFADGLNIPTGIQPLPRKPGAKGDTAIVFSIPSIWRFEDTDGDGKADKKEPLYEGFGFIDTHGMSSNYLHWIDGWIYGCHGFRNHSEVKDRSGKVTVFDSGNTYRFKPDGSAIEYYTHGQTNPFGLTVDPLGNFYSADSHSKPIYLLLRGGYYEGIGKQHDGLGFAPRITDDDHGSSAIAGIAYYADDKWPEEFRGNLFNGNPVTRRINRASLKWHGSTPKATREADFLTCDDPWFRPVQVKLGPDGALYIADFYNAIIGHYEVPLTDPRRDNQHGRIWRVVYRGENANNAPATAPDLAKMDAPALIEKLGDPNLIVRTLATNELVERVGAEATPLLRKIITPDGTAHVPPGEGPHESVPMWEHGSPIQRAHARIAFYHIGQPKIGTPDYSLFSNPRFRGEELSRIFTIKQSGEQTQWSDPDFECIHAALAIEAPASVRRAAWELLSRYPHDGLIAGDLLQWLRNVDSTDAELLHQAKIGLRDYLKVRNALSHLEGEFQDGTRESELIFQALLAVPTPSAAEFLLSHLQRTKLQTPRAGEYLRHAALHLPQEKLGALVTLVQQIGDAPLPQKLAVADGLGAAARQRQVKVPDELNTWMQRVMTDALSSTDLALVDRAIGVVRDTKLPDKEQPLRKIVARAGEHGPRRAAALEALMNLPAGIEAAAEGLRDPSSMTLRKKAAELLGNFGVARGVAEKNPVAEKARAVLLEVLPSAPGELAISIAAALAKSDEGAAGLLALAEQGKASAALLRHNAIAGPLGQRAAALKDRASALTKDLPPEDARLDAVIAARVESFRKAAPNAERGGQVYQQQCAVCHRFRNVGGLVGPNLDGMAARGVHRLIEDILDPNRNVDPAFRQTSIETTDGRMAVGANLREQDGTVVLTDATGKEQSFSKAAIKTQLQSRLSLMPPIFETSMPEADLNDLLVFLLSEN